MKVSTVWWQWTTKNDHIRSKQLSIQSQYSRTRGQTAPLKSF